MPMTWDDQNDILDLWHYYQNINDLMTGIQLDNENWFAGEPMVQNDKSVEMFYLRKGELGENTKIVGVVSNRTYNYWTQGIGSPCRDTSNNPEIDIYDEFSNYESSDLHQNIKLSNMGVFKGYQIDWYNALTGAFLETTEKISDALGNLKLEYPGTLTGNATCPILFFKLYRIDATFLTPMPPNDFETSLPQEFQLAEDLNPIELTPWEDSTNQSRILVSISPNPTTEVVNCTFSGDYSNLKWVLTNVNGQYLNENKIIDPNFTLDLSVYNSGSYYLLIQNTQGENLQTLKLIKQ